MLVDQRGQAGEDLIGDRAAGGLALGAGLVHVDRVPEHGRVEHEPEGAELVLHPFAVALAQKAVLAASDPSGERVAGLVQVLLGRDPPPVALVERYGQPSKTPVVGQTSIAQRGDPPRADPRQPAGHAPGRRLAHHDWPEMGPNNPSR